MKSLSRAILILAASLVIEPALVSACLPHNNAIDSISPAEGDIHPANGLIVLSGKFAFPSLTLTGPDGPISLSVIEDFSHSLIQDELYDSSYATKVYKLDSPPEPGSALTLSAKACDDCETTQSTYTAGPVDTTSPSPIPNLRFNIARFDTAPFHIPCAATLDANRGYYIHYDPPADIDDDDRIRVFLHEEGSDIALISHTHTQAQGLGSLSLFLEDQGPLCVSAVVMDIAGNVSQKETVCQPCFEEESDLGEPDLEGSIYQSLPIEPEWSSCSSAAQGPCGDATPAPCPEDGCSTTGGRRSEMPGGLLGVIIVTLLGFIRRGKCS